MLINATQLDEVRVAITDGTQLVDLDIEVPGQEQKKANIYKGVISSIEPSLGAAFVKYGNDRERHGFLPLKEISREYFLSQGGAHPDSVDIKKVLKEGQPLVIQVEKEERGTKGAALTTFISLAGSFLVLMPNNPRAGGISRRIEGEERDQLREKISQLKIPEGMGIIIRTAGVGKSYEELEWDLNILLRYWEAIKQAATIKSGSYLIHQESDVVIRGIRDYLRQDISEIIIDEENAYQRAFNYVSQIRPDLVSRVKLYKDSLPLFSRFQIEEQIESAYQREVRLPSGGSLVIDHSEALVAVDINSARATKGSNIEETALNTNLEAAQEIARQLKIRDIGGLVVIDFIDMTPSRNQRDVENCLRNALRSDRARIQIGRISRFGLLEMSRQRIRSSLNKSSHITCPRCEGQGTIRSIESQAISIIHLLQEQAAKARNIHFQLQLPLDIVTYITNEKRQLISQIEENCHVKVTIIPNQFLETPHYHMKQLKCNPEHMEHGKGVSSYKLLKSFKTEPATAPRKAPTKPSSEPAITQFLTTTNPPAPAPQARQTPSSNGLIKRLWSKMFGSEETTTPQKKPAHTKTSQQRTPNRRPPHQRNRPRPASGDKRSTGQHQNRKPNENKPGEQKRGERKPGDDRDKQHRTRRGSRGGQQRSASNQPTKSDKPIDKPIAKQIPPDTKQPYPDAVNATVPKSNIPTSHSDVPASQKTEREREPVQKPTEDNHNKE